jgi:hypothetical protein
MHGTIESSINRIEFYPLNTTSILCTIIYRHTTILIFRSFKCFCKLFQGTHNLPLIGKRMCTAEEARQSDIKWDQYLNISCILNISGFL